MRIVSIIFRAFINAIECGVDFMQSISASIYKAISVVAKEIKEQVLSVIKKLAELFSLYVKKVWEFVDTSEKMFKDFLIKLANEFYEMIKRCPQSVLDIIDQIFKSLLKTSQTMLSDGFIDNINIKINC